MEAKKIFCVSFIFVIILVLPLAGPVQGKDLSPEQNQEFIDAKKAMEAARKAQAEKYSADTMKTAREFLDQAESIRASKDNGQFTQTSRLARVYAELAEAMAQLRQEEENLGTAKDELQKIKAEIERLKKDQPATEETISR